MKISKIYAANASQRHKDLLERKFAYSEQNRKHKEELGKFRQAKKSVYAPVREEIQSILSKYDKLVFDIDVKSDINWNEQSLKDIEYLIIRVKCNDRDHFNPEKALSWSWEIKLDPSGYKKESNSWSGLQATTTENLESLKQTYEALVDLNEYNWDKFADVVFPEYEEYVKTPPAKAENFDREEREILAEEYSEEGLAIKCTPWLEPDDRYGTRYSKHYVIITGETPKQYRYDLYYPLYYAPNSSEVETYLVSSGRKSKEILLHCLSNPMETISVEELKAKTK